MTTNIITQEYLKELLYYNPDSGLFTWLVANSPRIKVGEPAGYIRTDGYVIITIDTVSYLAHRLAWLFVTGKQPENQIDHISGDKTDNRMVNLREATHAENIHNSSVRKNNKLGIKGVHKHQGKYQTQVELNGKKHYLGVYKTKEEASKAYKKFVKKHHKEFYYEQG